MDVVKTLVDAAALRLAGSHPYLSSALWAVPRTATDAVPTMAVDAAWRLFYNPDWVGQWSVEEVETVLYHELCHLIRDHASRRPDGACHHRWNVAADLEINDDLVEEKLPLPGRPLIPQNFRLPTRRTAEEYYQRLASADLPAPALLCGCCGAGAGGAALVDLPDSAPGATESDAALVRRRVAQDVLEYQRGCGKVPGGWTRWASEQIAPAVDWRRELASLVRRALADSMGATDYRYSRPSRRQSAVERIVLPSLRQAVARVAVVIDTSGSIDRALLERSLAEVRGILRAAGARDGVAVLSVDAAVHWSGRVTRAAQTRLAGGGGTDMGVGLAACERLRPRPDVAVVLTDGFTPWPLQAPAGMRVVVGLLDERGSVPAWARRVLIRTEGGK